MMDPLSVTGSITGVVSICIQIVVYLDVLRTRFQNAHVTITALAAQCNAIKTGLSQLQMLMVQNRVIYDRPDVISTFDRTLMGCTSVLSCLENLIGILFAAETGPRRSLIARLRNKASVVWNEVEMKGYLSLIQGQQSAISFLVQLLQMQSIDEILNGVRNGRRFLDQQATEAESLRLANPQVHVAESVLGSRWEPEDKFGDMVTFEREFDFDSIIVNTRPYRRAMTTGRQVLSKRRPVTTTKSTSSLERMRPIMNFPNTKLVRSTPNIPGQQTVPDITVESVHNITEWEERTRNTVQDAPRRPSDRSRSIHSPVLTTHDHDPDWRCHRHCDLLLNAVREWALHFSEAHESRACRLTSDIKDKKVISRLQNTILDGSGIDTYLQDRTTRSKVFLSLTMSIIWEFIFTRYFFDLDRQQRQKLRSVERFFNVSSEAIVRQRGAPSLSLLSSRDIFRRQLSEDAEVAVQEILTTLTALLPPPASLREQIKNWLRSVVMEAVELWIAMCSQREVYMMLPPLQPEYNKKGDRGRDVIFNASSMNNRSTQSKTNEELEASRAVVRMVLFPLVVKKRVDRGNGDEESVAYPTQVVC